MLPVRSKSPAAFAGFWEPAMTAFSSGTPSVSRLRMPYEIGNVLPLIRPSSKTQAPLRMWRTRSSSG